QHPRASEPSPMRSTALVLLLLLPACSAAPRTQTDPRTIFADYATSELVTESYYLAPWQCRPDPIAHAPPAAPRATPASPHGDKIFHLYTTTRGQYIAQTAPNAAGDLPVGFTIVKETWLPADGAEADLATLIERAREIHPADLPGRASLTPGPLFLMQ